MLNKVCLSTFYRLSNPFSLIDKLEGIAVGNAPKGMHNEPTHTIHILGLADIQTV